MAMSGVVAALIQMVSRIFRKVMGRVFKPVFTFDYGNYVPDQKNKKNIMGTMC